VGGRESAVAPSFEAHFVVDAEWLTSMVRQLWADEGEPEKALNILKAAFPKMEQADMLGILTGSKKLTGDSDPPGMKLERDDACESKLGNPLDLMRTLARFREKIDEDADWIQFLSHQTELVPSPEGLIEIPRRRTKYGSGTMAGAPAHSRFLNPAVDLDRIPHRKVFSDDRRRAMESPEAELEREKLNLTEEGDEVDGQRVLKAFKDEPEEEKEDPPPEPVYKISSDSGWLSPDGKFYGCSYEGHIRLAQQLGYEEKELENLNWVKMSARRFFRGNYDIEPSQKQRDLIFDWCHENGVKMPWLWAGDSPDEP
jgi:hypothetical protein